MAAIVAADIVGYSTLMGRDEVGTLERLKALRKGLIDPAVRAEGGRIVKTTGDGVLLEFPSVMNAFEACRTIQQGTAERQADEAADRIIRFRIGMHVGDVIVDEDDILGQGVNIAARLQEIGDPGGICLSEEACRHIPDRFDGEIVAGGMVALKNIATPVTIRRWRPEGGPVVIDGRDAPRIGRSSEKPALAILPFENLSNDPEQEFFVHGLVEEITLAISKLRWFYVMSSTSTAEFKGKRVDAQAAGKALDVRFVLHGSVRRAGTRMRISSALVDADTGNTIWGDHFDREVADVFDLQDEIALRIAGAIEPEMIQYERARSMALTSGNVDAWTLFHQAGAEVYSAQTRENFERSTALYRRALELDPGFTRVYGHLAYNHYGSVIYGWAEDRAATLRQGLEYARKALAADPMDFFAHFAVARLQMLSGEHSSAIHELNRALDINPSFALAHHGLAAAYVFTDRAAEAIRHADNALRLSPRDTLRFAFLIWKGVGHFLAGEIGPAVEALEQAGHEPSAPHLPWTMLAGVLCCAGRRDDAERALATAREKDPRLSVARVRAGFGRHRTPRLGEMFDCLEALAGERAG